jgi:hypothetical protein
MKQAEGQRGREAERQRGREAERQRGREAEGIHREKQSPGSRSIPDFLASCL